MNRLLPSSNYLLMGDKSAYNLGGGGGGGFMSAHVYLSLLWLTLEPLQKKACFWLYHVRSFARLLLTDLELV